MAHVAPGTRKKGANTRIGGYTGPGYPDISNHGTVGKGNSVYHAAANTPKVPGKRGK